jgi:hypothetical protein
MYEVRGGAFTFLPVEWNAVCTRCLHVHADTSLYQSLYKHCYEIQEEESLNPLNMLEQYRHDPVLCLHLHMTLLKHGLIFIAPQDIGCVHVHAVCNEVECSVGSGILFNCVHEDARGYPVAYIGNPCVFCITGRLFPAGFPELILPDLIDAVSHIPGFGYRLLCPLHDP